MWVVHIREAINEILSILVCSPVYFFDFQFVYNKCFLLITRLRMNQLTYHLVYFNTSHGELVINLLTKILTLKIAIETSQNGIIYICNTPCPKRRYCSIHNNEILSFLFYFFFIMIYKFWLSSYNNKTTTFASFDPLQEIKGLYSRHMCRGKSWGAHPQVTSVG